MEIDLFDEWMPMILEVWKPIPGLYGYEASSFGNVRSWWKNNKKRIGNGRGNREREIAGVPKLMKQHMDSYGYMITSVTDANGVHKSVKVHRLVAMAFIPNPKNFPEINHKDEDKLNNHFENLEWCDNKYNINYGTRTQRSADSRSIAVSCYDLEGNHIKDYKSSTEAGKAFNSKSNHISCCCLGKRNQAHGFQWRFKSEGLEKIEPVQKPKYHLRPVTCFDDDGNVVETYSSIKEACIARGVSSGNICQCLCGKVQHTGGLRWKYADSEV